MITVYVYDETEGRDMHLLPQTAMRQAHYCRSCNPWHLHVKLHCYAALSRYTHKEQGRPSLASFAVPRLWHKVHQLNKSGQNIKRAFDPLHDKEATFALC